MPPSELPPVYRKSDNHKAWPYDLWIDKSYWTSPRPNSDSIYAIANYERAETVYKASQCSWTCLPPSRDNIKQYNTLTQCTMDMKADDEY